MTIYSYGYTIFSFSHLEEITLGTNKEVHEVTEVARGMTVDMIREVFDWASEGLAAGVYGIDLKGSLWQG